MGRARNKVSIKPVLFIACEGTSTEYEYFSSWAQTKNVLDHFERVNVYPDENDKDPKTTPYQLYEKAKRELKDGSADFAWVVFDKDNHPGLNQTFIDAARAEVKIAFSARSFEQWVILHFEKNLTAFAATECKDSQGKPANCGSLVHCTPHNCLTGHIRRQNFIPAYSKKKSFDLYTSIFNNTEKALVNAAWLRSKINASINKAPQMPQNLNPYSDVDQLILKLNNRSDKIEWGNTGTDISLNNWTINVIIVNMTLVVRVSHTQQQAVILNLFHLSSFFTTDDNLNDNICNLISCNYVVNNNRSTNQILRQNDIIEYVLQLNNQPYFLFKNNETSTRIYIDLILHKPQKLKSSKAAIT